MRSPEFTVTIPFAFVLKEVTGLQNTHSQVPESGTGSLMRGRVDDTEERGVGDRIIHCHHRSSLRDWKVIARKRPVVLRADRQQIREKFSGSETGGTCSS